MRHFLVFGLFLILGFAGFMTYHLGALKPVHIEVSPFPQTLMVAKKHIGPYHTTVQAIEAVEKWMQEKGAPCPESFGLYLDDPRKVEAERMKSFGGCLITQDLEVHDLPENFQILLLPGQEVILAKFDGSPGIGPMKVYPQVEEFRVSKNIPEAKAALEIYQILDRTKPNSMKTRYLFLQELPSGM